MVAGKNYLKADPSPVAICFLAEGGEDWILGWMVLRG